MTVDPYRYAALKSSLVMRGIFYALGAFFAGFFGLVWGGLSAVGISNAARDPMTILAGVLVVFLGGVLPIFMAAILAWRAIVNLRDLSRVNELVAALSSGGVRSLDDLGRAMHLPAAQAERALTGAIGRGLVAPETLATLTGRAAVRAPGSAAPEAWLGRTIHGTYRVEAPLGHGGMGAVFRARHLPSGSTCALKMLFVSRYASPDALARFEREATLVRTLRHPSLVEMLDFGRAEDGTPYVVMELLEGETLEQRLARNGVVAWPDALRIAHGVGGALAMAHAAGLVHRDVKPANIMLAHGVHGERPVLIDFGLAKRVDVESVSGPRVTSTGVVVGTPLYMSPEQARGEPLDARSDLYGLAVVVYEMITGVPPFFDKTLAQVYQRLLSESPPPASRLAPGCAPAIDVALGCALAMRREERFGDVGAFLAALDRASA